MWISSVCDYDRRRKKLILDEGERCFLLYTGELRTLGLCEGDELPDDTWERILREILVPRAQKRALYYLKDGEKTTQQVAKKLREGLYPEEAIDETLRFLSGHRLVDDRRFAETYAEELRGKHAKREILEKLRQRGVPKAEAEAVIGALALSDDEEEACAHAIRKKLGRHAESHALSDLSEQDLQKTVAYLSRKGFSYETIRQTLRKLTEQDDPWNM